MKKDNLILYAALTLVILLTFTSTVLLQQNKKLKITKFACTMEAKLCPDGSAVDRVPPNCEFKDCPTDTDLSNWKTYINPTANWTFKYPPNWYVYDKGVQSVINGQEKWFFQKEFTYVSPNKFPEAIQEGTEFIFDGISIRNDDRRMTFEEYLSELEQNPQNKKLVRINNIQAIKLIDDNIANESLPQAYRRLNFIYYFENYNQSRPVIQVIYSEQEYNEKNKKVFDQILSTFKFLGSITPTCTPRPACLDATPRCLIPETPDMCPPGYNP